MRQQALMSIFALLFAGMIGDLGAVQILQSSEGERLEHIPDVPLFVWLGEKGQQECFEIFLDGQLETTSCEEHTILSTASWRDIQSRGGIYRGVVEQGLVRKTERVRTSLLRRVHLGGVQGGGGACG